MSNQIILDNVSGEARIFDIVAPADLKNGNLVVIGEKNDNGTYDVAAPAAITDLNMAIVLSVPLSKEADRAQDDYVIETGAIERAYMPYKGMAVSIPQENIEDIVDLDDGVFVIPQAADAEMRSIAALGGTETVAWIIEDLYVEFGVPMAKIRCIVA